MAAIEVQRIAGPRPLARVAPEWEELADRCGAWPCQYPGWLEAWYEAFARGTPEVLVARTNGIFSGAVGLLHRPWGLRSPTNWHTARFGLVAAGSPERAALADAIVQRSLPVRLRFLHAGDPTGAAIRSAARAVEHGVLARELPPSPYLDTSGGRDRWWDGLSARMRRELRRRRRKLEEHGRLTVEIHGTTGPHGAYLREGFAIEGSGWKERRGTAIRSRPETLGFYQRIAGWAEARGTLRLVFLRLDGSPIAFDLALEDRRAHYLLKTGFDRRLAAFAPGQLLRQEMIERAFSTGLQAYDFLGAPEPWKLAWTDASRRREELVIFPPTVRGRMSGTVHAKLLPLARRARAAWGRP